MRIGACELFSLSLSAIVGLVHRCVLARCHCAHCAVPYRKDLRREPLPTVRVGKATASSVLYLTVCVASLGLTTGRYEDDPVEPRPLAAGPWKGCVSVVVVDGYGAMHTTGIARGHCTLRNASLRRAGIKGVRARVQVTVLLRSYRPMARSVVRCCSWGPGAWCLPSNRPPQNAVATLTGALLPGWRSSCNRFGAASHL